MCCNAVKLCLASTGIRWDPWMLYCVKGCRRLSVLNTAWLAALWQLPSGYTHRHVYIAKLDTSSSHLPNLMPTHLLTANIRNTFLLLWVAGNSNALNVCRIYGEGNQIQWESSGSSGPVAMWVLGIVLWNLPWVDTSPWDQNWHPSSKRLRTLH